MIHVKMEQFARPVLPRGSCADSAIPGWSRRRQRHSFLAAYAHMGYGAGRVHDGQHFRNRMSSD